MIALPFLLEALSRILQHIFLLVLPMRDHFRFSLWRTVIFLCTATLASMVLSVLLLWLLPDTSNTRFLASCFGLICSLLTFLPMTKGPIFPLLLVFFLQASYRDNIKLIVRVVELCIHPDGLPQAVGALWFLGLTVATLPLMYAVIRILVCPILGRVGHQPFWRNLWQIPAVNYLIFRLSIYPSYFAADDRLRFPWSLLLLIWPVATSITYFVILRLIRSATDRMALQRKLEEENALLTMLEAAYDQQRSEMEEVRTVRHDMRHHLLAVRRLLASGHTEEARQYLADCIGQMTEEGPKGDV